MLDLGVDGWAKVPLAGEPGNIAELLHPISDGQHGLARLVRALGIDAWHATLALA